MVIFDDAGRLVATHCVNRKADLNYRLIKATVKSSKTLTVSQCPDDITRVEQIRQVFSETEPNQGVQATRNPRA